MRKDKTGFISYYTSKFQMDQILDQIQENVNSLISSCILPNLNSKSKRKQIDEVLIFHRREGLIVILNTPE